MNVVKQKWLWRFRNSDVSSLQTPAAQLFITNIPPSRKSRATLVINLDCTPSIIDSKVKATALCSVVPSTTRACAMAQFHVTSLCTLVLVALACSLSTQAAEGVKKLPETKDEVVADFENWVKSVGEKHAAFDRAAKSAGSVDELASKVGETVIVVDQSGAGNYKTINEALNAVPLHNKAPVTIKVNAGTYVERVVVPKSKQRITLQGAGRDVTKITEKNVAGNSGTTYTSSTFGVSAPYFTARNISFENSSPPPNGGVQQQAVALRTTGDFNAFYGCAFYGHQDTLYDHRGRHFFKDTLIVGTEDFIFGGGKSLYKNCELRVLPSAGGSLTAQKRMSGAEDSGYSFVNCKVTGSMPPQVYLGRAWGPYSRVVFALTEFAGIIKPVGWYNWGDPAREKTVYYAQYKCFGPGANQAGRASFARELTDAEAAPFLSLNYIDGGLWGVSNLDS